MTAQSDPAKLTDLDLRTHEWLKKEIESAVQETRALERYALVGTALVWAFLLRDVCQCPPRVLWWIPCVLSVVAALRVHARYLGMAPRTTYLSKIEKRGFQSGGLGGLEEHWRLARSSRWLGKTAFLFWLLVILARGLIPVWIIAGLDC